MRILYAVQATGNGHVVRAREVIPALRRYGTVDVFLSGSANSVKPDFPVARSSRGLSLRYDGAGRLNYLATAAGLRPSLLKEILSLPVERYDLVVNDFECISAWACILKGKRCVALSHQAAVIMRNAPKPARTDPAGLAVLHGYAPVRRAVGLHFKRYDTWTDTPVIRREIRETSPRDLGHYTVYLPSYEEATLVRLLSGIDVPWEVFSRTAQRERVQGNVRVLPVSAPGFAASLADSTGVLTSAGFETPAEALFLGKKLFILPIQGQFEQECNAAALAEMGVPVARILDAPTLRRVADWASSGSRVQVSYPDNVEHVVARALHLALS